jgi:hypothetical protein
MDAFDGFAGSRSDVDDPVAGRCDGHVVLHDDDRVSGFDEPSELGHQLLHSEVFARGRGNP